MTAVTGGRGRRGRGPARAALVVAGTVACAVTAWATEPPFRPQQGPLWCWAASSQMILEQLDSHGDFSQASQAEKALADCGQGQAPTNACGNAFPYYGNCGKGGFPSFRYFDYKAVKSCEPLKWPVLKAELDACRPFVFGWCIPGKCGDTPVDSSGHWMVAAAASVCRRVDGSTVPIIKVFNPAPCCRGQVLWIPYSLYQDGPSTLGFWQNHYRVHQANASVPTETGSGCRLTTDEVPQPEATFEQEGDGAGLVEKVLAACLPTIASWQSSGLLRMPVDPAAFDGKAVPMAPVRREIRSFTALEAAGFLHAPAVPALPAMWVYPVRVGNQVVGNVVLEEREQNKLRLVAIEDSESARTLLARLDKAGAAGNPLEIIVMETGVPFLLAGGNAVATAVDIDCRKPSSEQQPILKMPYSDFRKMIQPP